MALYHGHLSFVVPIVDESMRKIFRATGHRFDTDIPIWHLIIDMQAVLIQTKEILWRWPNIGPTNSLGNARTWACYYYTYSRVHSKWCWVSALKASFALRMTFTIWSKLPKSKCWPCPRVLLWRWWMRMFASQSRPLAPFLHSRGKGAGHPMANPKTRSIYVSILCVCLLFIYLSY